MISLICGIKNKNQKQKTTKQRKPSSYIQNTDRWLPEARWGVAEMGEGSQKVQTSSYKINKSWECNVQHGNSS